MSLFSIGALNIATQVSLALHLALFTSFFDPNAAAFFLGAYIYRDVVLHANAGELQALLFAKKYDDFSININKLVLYLGISIVQLAVWLFIFIYLRLPQFMVAIILIEYLMFYPVNLLKGYGKVKEALTLQLIMSLCGLLSISLSWALRTQDIEFYMQARILIALLLLPSICILAKIYLNNLLKTSDKKFNKKAQLKEGFYLQAKELYLVSLLTAPKFIASNILEPRFFTAFMVSLAAMSACSSLLQAMHQRNFFHKLNEIQVLDNQKTNIISQLFFAVLLTVLCYFAGASWVKKDLTTLSFYEIEPMIILLYNTPVLLMPVIFLKFRTDSYNVYHILPIITLAGGFYISTYTSNIALQVLPVTLTVILILFAAKARSIKRIIGGDAFK
jgi:hypothetical protein